MRADSYTFTQQFGCVPQLGNLYFPGEGCPSESPVIHTGIDLAAPEGTPFYAAASGWVTLADYDRPTADANTRIIIQHDGRNENYATDYLHWIASYVKEGDYVRAGDPIGEVGSVGFSTGPHLHFSVTDLQTGEHIDPLRWLPREAGLEGYVSRRPAAQLRLPAGTTAGQPESADPSPPPPPERQDVPKNPPSESGGRDQSTRQDKRKGEKPPATKSDDSATVKSNRSGEKSSDTPGSDASTKENAEKERSRTQEPDRNQERGKEESPTVADDSGDDGRTSNNRDERSEGDRLRNRRSDADDPGPENQNPSSENGRAGRRSDGQSNSGAKDKNDGGQSDSGAKDKNDGGQKDSAGKDSNGAPPAKDQDSSGKGKNEGEGGKDSAKADSGEGDVSDVGEETSDVTAPGNGGNENGSEGSKRVESSESDAVTAPVTAERGA